MERNIRTYGPSSANAAETNRGTFDWQKHEVALDEMFFKNSALFSRDSKEFKDFWPFFYRYQSFKLRQHHGKTAGGSRDDRQSSRQPPMYNSERKADISASPSSSIASAAHHEEFISLSSTNVSSSSRNSVFESLPSTYNALDRINLTWSPATVAGATNSRYRNMRYFQQHYTTSGQQLGSDIPKAKIEEFKDGVTYYLQFLQKQKFEKVQKIKRDRSNLPIAQFKEDIVTAVGQNQVVVVAGDTGCGKSTQVPQFLLEAGFEHIACTQPRRIACISLAKRVAFETLNEYGSQVAYKIRFESTTTLASKIIFLTEGLLLRQISSDANLSQHNVIIVDEVHERHIHGDFLLGVLRCLLQSRSDLKLVLMSATINIDLFSSYFDNCPVIKVPGRLYPIELQYVPIEHTSNPKESRKSRDQLDPRNYLRVLEAIDHKYPSDERGDLLIFVSGMKEIQALVDELKIYAQETSRWIVLALHSALSVSEQDKVFDIAPDGIRKCIISTNIAETSVTIDGVRFILDSGKVKEMGYDSTAKMRRLQEYWISRASAEQRKGRAGRTGPGICYRLYSQADYESLQPYSTPEIQRVPLDSLVLQMASLGLEDLRSFPFIEPPNMQSLDSAILYLKEHGALDGDDRLTTIGGMLSQLPVDVMIGKLLIMATVFQVVQPVLTMAACLSVQSPFHRMADGNLDVQRNRRSLESEHGDPFTLLTAFNEWLQVKSGGDRSGGQSYKWCKRRGLEQQRFYEIAKLRRQFEAILNDHGLVQVVKDDASSDDEDGNDDRHGDRKGKKRLSSKQQKERSLRQLKRQHRQDSRKRKVLRLDENEAEDAGGSDAEEVGDGETDLRDMEFKLTHNLGQLQRMAGSKEALSLIEVNIIKIILCSGLYPHLAVADEYNNWKRDSDHVFHSKSKQFVLLHPTSVFASQPQLLMPEPDETAASMPAPDLSIRQPKMARRHELIAFVDLLETNKPYFVNNTRVPALQTLLLFARSLDTNFDCTRIIADEWLEVCVEDAAAGEQLISSAQQLRSSWCKLLDSQLQAKDSGMSFQISPRQQEQQRILAQKLAEFLDCSLCYSLRKFPSSELKTVYVGPDANIENTSDLESHPFKGGVQVNEYLTFNCLQCQSSEEYGGALLRFWRCPSCDTALLVTPADRLIHEEMCKELRGAPNTGGSEGSSSLEAITSGTLPAPPSASNLSALTISYRCETCQKEYSFTPTQILQHKKSHA